MSAQPSLTFKIADQPWEIDAVHRLNYRTFSVEIPQHAQNETGMLVDKFHAENTYIIALKSGELAGMVALRGNRPFSLDEKLPNLNEFLPAGRRCCEIRLLAVEKENRFSQVTAGLLTALAKEALRQGYDSAVISGTTRQIKLYGHLGFQAFGPLVGTSDSAFQPMFLSFEAFQQKSNLLRSPEAQRQVNFLPGPVAMKAEVREAFTKMPESHRSSQFLKDYQEVAKRLCELANARYVELLTGSGTLANEAIAAQIKLLGKPGIIVSIGEFGERLVDQAKRLSIPFVHVRRDWGQLCSEEELVAIIQANPDAGWLWTAHCETSTSMLNHLPMLRRLCDEHELKLCLDCVSTLGVIPIDLSGVWLASAASGKGLASYPGLSMVFHNHEIKPQPDQIPRYLDLGLYASADGVPFTLNSNLLHALQASLRVTNWQEKMSRIARIGRRMHQSLRELGLNVVGCSESANPAVITIAIPPPATSRNLGWQFHNAGFLLSYQSNYLLARNWLQICLMGEFDDSDIDDLLATAKSILQPAMKDPEPQLSATT